MYSLAASAQSGLVALLTASIITLVALGLFWLYKRLERRQ